jgi:hypothetical protein
MGTILKAIGAFLLIILCGAAGVAAAILFQYYYPAAGSIAGLEMYVDGTLYPNGTELAWGSLQPSYEYTLGPVTVKNVGMKTLTVYIVSEGLPSTWTLTWTNQTFGGGNATTLAPGQQTQAPLNLTVPATASSWPDWGIYLNGE